MTTPGFQFNYTDPKSGFNLPTAWIVISEAKEDSPTTTMMGSRVPIRYDVYANQSAYTSGKSAIFPSNAYIVSYTDSPNTVWTTYFDESVMSQANHTIMIQSYAALQAYLTSL